MPNHRIARTSVRNVVVSDKTIWRFVIAETDGGISGFGEATLDGVSEGFDTEIRSAASSLEGRVVGEKTLAPLAALLDRGLEGRTIHSALDQAVCDLLARIKGIPLSALLGRSESQDRVTLYANINRSSRDRSPQSIAANAASAIADGFRAVKVAAFDGLAPGLCDKSEGEEAIAAGLARLEAMAAAAPGAQIMVDCHWRFSPAAARKVLPRLAEIGVTWFECPLPETPDQINALRDLRRAANALGIRQCGLETHGGWDHVAPFVSGGAYDVIMPDVKHAGSLGAILEIARNASPLGVSVSLHNPAGPVAHAVSVHTAAAIGGAERLEIQWRESDMFQSLTDPAPVVEQGVAQLSECPGLGTTLKLFTDEEMEATR